MKKLNSIVLLIDADNTQMDKVEGVIREISAHGRIVVKRAYANWQKDNLKNWADMLKRLAIKAQQQFDYVSGKNATDIALVIDALDLLYKEMYDSFVIVTSDSDYTPLAIRLHESGVHVIGVGEEKTPKAFRNACDEFILLENLDLAEKKGNEALDEKKDNKNLVDETNKNQTEQLEEIHKLLKIASDKYQDEDGFVNVSAAGAFIKRAKPDFDLRTYGFLKLPQLLEEYDDKYEIKKYPGKGKVTIISYKCI